MSPRDAAARLHHETHPPRRAGGRRVLEAQRHPRPCQIQWDRTLRWQQRARSAVARGDWHESRDFLLVLYENIFAMRDWITASRPDLKPEVGQLFERSTHLRVIRDLANGSKHLDINSPSSSSGMTILRVWTDSGPILTIPMADGQNLQAMVLAEEARNLIHSFLKSHELAD